MRRYPIICALLLAACGREAGEARLVTPPVDLGILQPVTGWTGATPATEGDLISAAAAEKRGLMMCNGQLETVARILARPALH
jgi:hypothetical protein